mmetsp:Transcript_17424/g.29415  ORF Transcript_17424/g.29415 Transcript_17424/m.29415 type:complete len:248 (-) Transcript_17424:48-791(-)|eukprot:CAMPEP_0174981642 /NCGR_PEP_ID=MMETSP0004_2-20121128/16013_1 /TAXON_ID=420556 /ORGANISM="Ochromonas sp., Strain CCMP1393" /LENGTH=247 /DNA_ID=CAMNT_0016233429 /DNA_START=84 /DNA_END=827 /DNA_ORIENTATION=-
MAKTVFRSGAGLILLVIVVLVHRITALHTAGRSRATSQILGISSFKSTGFSPGCLKLYAKKGKKQKGSGKGFSKAPIDSSNDSNDESSVGIAATTQTTSGITDAEDDLEQSDADIIFKKYGIKTEDVIEKEMAAKRKKTQQKKEDAAFGEDVIARIPAKTQTQIDQILITGTFVTLTFVVLCGIGISYGAFKIVFPDVLIAPELDNLIVNVLSPSFTPALGVFLLFSVTLGLFKFAQISSDQTVYKE